MNLHPAMQMGLYLSAQPETPVPTAVSPAPPAQSSRRRRLWELPSQTHCPVIGMCMPLAVLRRLADKCVGGLVIAADYELHRGVVTDCRQRTRLAEAVQRELDRRHAGPLRHASALKSAEALTLWWREQSTGGDVAGALWATLTHPRCEPQLVERVLQDVHMLQHQVGTVQRTEQSQLQALAHENAVLARELAGAQQRSTQMAQEQGRKVEQLQGQVLRLQAELVGRETALAQLREALHALEQSVPGLKSRMDLSRRNAQLLERIQALERELLGMQQQAGRNRRQTDRSAASPLSIEDGVWALTAQSAPGEPLVNRAVLCVGGRTASVPTYRELVEEAGARFLHHDGGEQDKVTQLDASLAAADLVICQTGCISHDAYWRVKDHCKRTGKPCVFVEQPSRSSLQRALGRLTPGVAIPLKPVA